eukprot:gene25659-biopygen22503
MADTTNYPYNYQYEGPGPSRQGKPHRPKQAGGEPEGGEPSRPQGNPSPGSLNRPKQARGDTESGEPKHHYLYNYPYKCHAGTRPEGMPHRPTQAGGKTKGGTRHQGDPSKGTPHRPKQAGGGTKGGEPKPSAGTPPEGVPDRQKQAGGGTNGGNRQTSVSAGTQPEGMPDRPKQAGVSWIVSTQGETAADADRTRTGRGAHDII